MSPRKNALASFLSEQKQKFLEDVTKGRPQDWTIVMGNEAGDLDSIASAIAYAWYATTIRGFSAIPLFQTSRSDLHLRAENLHALSLAGIGTSCSDILCIDDVPSRRPFPAKKFVLVDHNCIQPIFLQDNSDARVVAVIDHHTDEGLYHETADPRIIAVPTGSCSSLVAQLLHAECPDTIPPELATLLLCAVLIDTGGLKPGGKAENADRLAAIYLAPRSNLVESTGSHFSSDSSSELHKHDSIQQLHHILQEKKASIAHLNTRDLLRRDFKEYTMKLSWSPSREVRVGLASVPIGLKSWISQDENFWSDTVRWMDECQLMVLGILTSFRDTEKHGKNGHGKHRREQLFVVRKGEEGLAEKLFTGLEESDELRLKREDFSDFAAPEHAGFGPGFQGRVWKQKNTDATRKATAPLVKSIIQGTERPAAL